MEGIDVETGEKIGFFERLKIAIFKFEDYAKLAAQKISCYLYANFNVSICFMCKCNNYL